METEKVEKNFFSNFFKSWRCRLRKIRHCIRCHLLSKPPKGNAPTTEQYSRFIGAFPNLRKWSITAPWTNQYNCIAWSVGVTDQWIWPGSTVQDFDEFYASYGWSLSTSCEREFKKRKVALFAYNSDPNDCTHGSRETDDCSWHESKCGGWERIMHIKTEMESGVYGNIIRCYEKQDDKANLDLC
jgi:hypothetical protein